MRPFTSLTAQSPCLSGLALTVMACALPLLTGCGAVYPELSTPLRTPVSTQQLDPAPPDGLYWIAIKEGIAPEKTRDGRPWHELGNPLPDPFAVLYVNGKELIKTNPESSSTHPTWSDSIRGNFRVDRSDRFRIEMWQSGLVHKPICVRDLSADPDEWVIAQRVRVTCEGGAEVIVSFEPAHGRVGYGLYYELRTSDVYVTRVFEQSPAGRAGIKPGDQIVRLGDRAASQMSPAEIENYFNAPKDGGLSIGIRHPDNTTADLSLKEGAIYPLFSELGRID